MKNFIQAHIKELESFCAQNSISVEKVLNSPKSYTEDIMWIQHIDKKLADLGLNDETPAEVILTIQKTSENKLEFIPGQNLMKYLA